MESANESNPVSPPSISLFMLLPEEIVLSILARIPRLYYPTLCLVSKSFRSLIISEKLGMMRSYLGTREACVYLCIQSRTHPRDVRWFGLWINPNDCNKPLLSWTSEDKCTGNSLLRVPSSYFPGLAICYETVGSETYEIGGQNKPSSSDVWVYKKLIGTRVKAPSMMVARKNPLMCSLDGKLYVMGGCEGDECCWAEVFDPKTQTWEPLPDPGVELRFSLIKKLDTEPGKVFLRSNSNNFVYLVKEYRWEVYRANFGESICKIDGVWYSYDQRKCWWYDTMCGKWTLVGGLAELCQEISCGLRVEIGSYGGKLVIFWVGRPSVYPFLGTSPIWCAVILLKKDYNPYGEVWGQVEWADRLTAPWSNAIRLSCVESVQ